MLISHADMLLVRAQRMLAWPLWYVAQLENSLLASQLQARPVEQPVFVCGLARSGSTMLVELLNQLPGVVGPRYRDFPFVAVPWVWNRYWDVSNDRAPVAHERPHQDGIMITAESPEAMDEPLWRTFGRNLPAWQLDSVPERHPMRQFYHDYLRKLLLIRGGQRIVAKNNYHVARLALLAQWYDAQFVVPVRHPVRHVDSLMRQHQLFCQYSRADRRVPEYLAAAGHFEFGPQRQAHCPTAQQQAQIEAQWRDGHEAIGYALQWAAVYEHILQALQTPLLRERIHLVRYEEFCQQPTQHWQQLCARLKIAQSDSAISLAHIRPVCPASRLDDHLRQAIWQHTKALAQQFGYIAA